MTTERKSLPLTLEPIRGLMAQALMGSTEGAAKMLGKSTKTIKNQNAQLRKKLGTESTLQSFAMLVALDIITPELCRESLLPVATVEDPARGLEVEIVDGQAA